jgi:hypothetical protein
MHLIEILGGAERHCSPETFDDLVLFVREFGHNSLMTRLVPLRDFPRHEESAHELL